MKMDLKQTRLVGLTMELDLKTQEYKKLCNALEDLKQSGIEPNDPRLLPLLEAFHINNKEIIAIKKQLEGLK